MKKIFVITCIVALMLSGCGKAEKVAAPKLLEPIGVDVDTAVVKKMDLSNTNNYPAQVVPIVVPVAFEGSGSIGTMKVKIGQKVKKGQLLATLEGASDKEERAALVAKLKQTKISNKEANAMLAYNIKTYQTQIKQLNQQLNAAKESAVKAKIKIQIISMKEDMKIGKLKIRQQKEMQALDINRQEKAMVALKDSVGIRVLKAPVAGEVVSTCGGKGYMVQGGSPAVQIADMNRSRIKTSYIGEYELSQVSQCSVIVDGKSYEVKVEEDKTVNNFDDAETFESEESGTDKKDTYFDFIKMPHLTIGGFATLQLSAKEAKEGLVIPANALHKDSGTSKYVYVSRSNARERVEITVGVTTDAYVEVLTGLKEGDIVYVG